MSELGARNYYSPDLASKQGIDSIKPVVEFLVIDGLHQVAAVFGDHRERVAQLKG